MNIIIGNVISVLGEGVNCFGFAKAKNRGSLLIFNVIGCLVQAIALLFLGAYDGAINALVTTTRLTTNYFKDKYNKKWNFLFIIFFILHTLPFIKFAGIRTVFNVLAVMFSFVPKWWTKDMKIIRITTLISYAFSIIYGIYILDWAIIPIELVSVVGLIIGLINQKDENKKREE